MTRIALDAMGGDHAPQETVKGAIAAAGLGFDVVLVGDESRLRPLLAEAGATLPIVHAPEEIGMGDDVASAIRDRRRSSISVAARMVADGEAAGLVSAGSTGAAVAAGAILVGRLPGASRPALAAIFPVGQPTVVLDIGANLEVRPANLLQFAVMGRVLAQVHLGLEDPAVGLLNVGEEPGKGRPVEKEAHALLAAAPGALLLAAYDAAVYGSVLSTGYGNVGGLFSAAYFLALKGYGVTVFEKLPQAGGMLRVGSPSDRPFEALRDMTVTLLGFLTIPSGERDAWSFSLFYSPTGQIVYPLPGIAYVWRPSPQFQANVGIPFSLEYRPTDTLSLTASYRPLNHVQVQVRQSLGEHWSVYGSYQTVNETFWLADRLDDDQRMYVFDQRLTLGVQRELGWRWSLDVSAAYVFDRQVFQAEKFSGSRRDELGIEPGVAGTLQLIWTR